MRLLSCNHTNKSALHAWPQTGMPIFCVLRHFTTAVLKADIAIDCDIGPATFVHSKAKQLCS